MFDYFMSASQFSVPVAIVVPLLLGFDMSDINDLSMYQEEIFNIFENWKALQSSYTTYNDGGIPRTDTANLN